jgi:hypothetical protein
MRDRCTDALTLRSFSGRYGSARRTSRPFERRHGRLWRGSFPTSQRHSRPSAAAGENAPRQDIPLEWVRGVERLYRLPAHVGVAQHRWGVFLNDVRSGDRLRAMVPVGSPRKSAAIIPFVNE